MNNLQECIDQVIVALQNMQKEIKEISDFENQETKITAQEEKSVTVVQEEINDDDFKSLIEALNSDKWPEAVNKHLVCDPSDEEEKVARGRGILELMVGSTQSQSFLDFGCGEGYCTRIAAEKGARLSMGYDIKNFDTWSKNPVEQMTFTTNWQTVVDKGPYDSILCFDVIDHAQEEDPIDLLKKMKQVLAPDGRIYMRTHPWTSRHANHFYHHLNKAYLHLVFTPEELKKVHPSWGNDPLFEPNIGVTKPIMTYKNLIEEAGLEVEHMREIKEDVEDFFQTPAIGLRIQDNTGMTQFPMFQMTLQFIDFFIRH